LCGVALAVAIVEAGGCSTTDPADPPRDAAPPVEAHVTHDAAAFGAFCRLPGSYVNVDGSLAIVAGGKGPDLRWLTVPPGFCAHYYGNVTETRLLRFAPNGDLFVASPSTACAGGANGGLGAVVVLPDDDGDGYADSIVHYKDSLPSTQGMLFHDGFFYYQDGTKVMRTPYATGDRKAPPTSEQMVDVTFYSSATHWPKAIDADDSGNVYVTNGGDEGDKCDPSLPESQRPFHGGILRIDGSADGEMIAKGLRNPIALRCAHGTGTCFGLELAHDFAPNSGSREKLFPVHKGDDWGFPYCATQNLAFPGVSCSGVQPETTSFIIDHTPFDLDFEPGAYAAPWKSRAFVAMHGYFVSWTGARIVAIATDPKTGLPVTSSEANPGTAFSDFATGWDNSQNPNAYGRPATLAFAPDGRLFIGNDTNGDILWIAPVGAADVDSGTRDSGNVDSATIDSGDL
jgi:glucose/arabinose dehydrogenase